MSALWGFTGPPDAGLVCGMGNLLRHRTGGAAPAVDTRPARTIAVAGSDPTRVGMLRDADSDVSVAFVGRLAPGWSAELLLKLVTTDGTDAISQVRGD